MEFDQYDSLSALDARYWDKEVATYLSENAFTRYKLAVEVALIKVLARLGVCPEEAVRIVTEGCDRITTDEIYEEEGRLRHDIRALVNRIRLQVPDHIKPYIHMTATSYDIVDTANAARYRDVVLKVLMPRLVKLEKILINLAASEADTVQIGRTHGQHAVPITFGFTIAGYVSRLGQNIEALYRLANALPGKFSGAVGAYNASSLFFKDARAFEAEVLAELGLLPAEHSTQIVPPEALMRLLYEVGLSAGIMGNLARDMRQLQRTEIGEVGEEFAKDQVGSSTMPQKRNPINFENVESMMKIVIGRQVTVLMDQVSEHQRDLTNSASARTYGEIFAYVASMAKRLAGTMSKLTVDRGNLERNLLVSRGGILAEPLYIILAALGHPDAHGRVKDLTLQAQRQNCSLQSLVPSSEDLKPYLGRMSEEQIRVINDPLRYLGIAAERARTIVADWKANGYIV